MRFNIGWLLLLLSLSTSVLGNYTLSMQVSNRIEVRIGTLLAVPSGTNQGRNGPIEQSCSESVDSNHTGGDKPSG